MKKEDSKQKIPTIIILILIYIGLGAVGSLQLILNPVVQVGPVFLKGAGAIILTLVFIAVYIILFCGIIKRLKWARTLGIIWYPLSIILELINTIFSILDKSLYTLLLKSKLPAEFSSTMVSSLANIISITTIFLFLIGAVISILITIYLTKKKDYFAR